MFATQTKPSKKMQTKKQIRMSKTNLVYFMKSPFHYWANVLSPDAPPFKETDAMRVGKAFDSLLLTPNLFEQNFACAPDVDRRTKDGKAIYEEFIQLNQGKTIISNDQWDTIHLMYKSVLSNPTAKMLLDLPGEPQKYLEWNDSLTGAPCKGYSDKFCANGSEYLILEVKSVEDASPEAFGKAVINYYNDLQASLYVDAFEAMGYGRPAFIWIAVENKYPYQTALYYAPENLLQSGTDRYRPYLKKWMECLENNEWPGYSDKIEVLQTPSWFNYKNNLTS